MNNCFTLQQILYCVNACIFHDGQTSEHAQLSFMTVVMNVN